MFYPVIYELCQMFREGFDYFLDPWNIKDILFITASIVNCVFQHYFGPRHTLSQISMILLVLTIIPKTFFYLRIFPSLTPIIVMLGEVVSDLKAFLLFFSILILMLGQVFAVLQCGVIKDPKL